MSQTANNHTKTFKSNTRSVENIKADVRKKFHERLKQLRDNLIASRRNSTDDQIKDKLLEDLKRDLIHDYMLHENTAGDVLLQIEDDIRREGMQLQAECHLRDEENDLQLTLEIHSNPCVCCGKLCVSQDMCDRCKIVVGLD